MAQRRKIKKFRMDFFSKTEALRAERGGPIAAIAA
jgi:hypothetical protein